MLLNAHHALPLTLYFLLPAPLPATFVPPLPRTAPPCRLPHCRVRVRENALLCTGCYGSVLPSRLNVRLFALRWRRSRLVLRVSSLPLARQRVSAGAGMWTLARCYRLKRSGGVGTIQQRWFWTGLGHHAGGYYPVPFYLLFLLRWERFRPSLSFQMYATFSLL